MRQNGDYSDKKMFYTGAESREALGFVFTLRVFCPLAVRSSFFQRV